MMNGSAALFALVLLGAPPSESPERPITVTAHPWAPFISPMGEPFRAHSTSDDTLAAWFQKADRNHDGRLTVDEMVTDAERFFATLDTNHDGLIDPDELDHYEWEVAPEIQVNSKTRRPPGQPARTQPAARAEQSSREERRDADNQENSSLGLNGDLQGAARYGLLNIPEPVAAADANLDRAISLAEFRQAAVDRFNMLDSTHSGVITLGELEVLRQQLQGAAHPRHHREERDTRLGNSVPGDP